MSRKTFLLKLSFWVKSSLFFIGLHSKYTACTKKLTAWHLCLPFFFSLSDSFKLNSKQTRAAKHRCAALARGSTLLFVAFTWWKAVGVESISSMWAVRVVFSLQNDATVRTLHEALDTMEEAASQLEREHVHSVYDKIAPYFNDSRYKAWPKVRQFLLDLQPGSIVADVGRRPAMQPAGAR